MQKYKEFLLGEVKYIKRAGFLLLDDGCMYGDGDGGGWGWNGAGG